MRRWQDRVIRSGEVTVEKGGKKYTASYDVLKAGRGHVVVRLQTGQATHPIGDSEELTARTLLRELTASIQRRTIDGEDQSGKATVADRP